MADEFLLEAIKYNSGLVLIILIFTAMYVSASSIDLILSLIKKHKKNDK